jgi:hypothetical protein
MRAAFCCDSFLEYPIPIPPDIPPSRACDWNTGLLSWSTMVSKEEFNFKSRLIEWGQKHKVDIEFALIETIVDQDNNPGVPFIL